MTRDVSPGDIFGRKREDLDADWQMFCRGRRAATDEDTPWVVDRPRLEADAGRDDDSQPVTIEPPDDAPGDVDAQDVHDPAAVRHFIAKVVGISYPNDD